MVLGRGLLGRWSVAELGAACARLGLGRWAGAGLTRGREGPGAQELACQGPGTGQPARGGEASRPAGVVVGLTAVGPVALPEVVQRGARTGGAAVADDVFY